MKVGAIIKPMMPGRLQRLSCAISFTARTTPEIICSTSARRLMAQFPRIPSASLLRLVAGLRVTPSLSTRKTAASRIVRTTPVSRARATLFTCTFIFGREKTVSLAGLKTGVKSARLLASGQQVKFQQDRFRVRFTGLPAEAPDSPVTTIAIDCESEPVQDTDFVRRERPRNNV